MAKTGPQCSICKHKSRHGIEIGLAHGISHNALARKFNVSADAIGRHAANHVSPAMRAAILTAQQPSAVDLEALQASETEGLLSNLVHQRARLQMHVAMAIDFGDVKAAIAAEGAITSNLQLVSRLLGMIVQRHDVRSTSVLISSDYLQLRQALVQALRPFPAAAAAVGRTLATLEAEAATDITQRAGKAPVLIEHDDPAPAISKVPPPPRIIPPPPIC